MRLIEQMELPLNYLVADLFQVKTSLTLANSSNVNKKSLPLGRMFTINIQNINKSDHLRRETHSTETVSLELKVARASGYERTVS